MASKETREKLAEVLVVVASCILVGWDCEDGRSIWSTGSYITCTMLYVIG
jgi:hypothetical protein